MIIENYLNKLVDIEGYTGIVIDIESLDIDDHVIVILESLEIEEEARYIAIPTHIESINMVSVH